MKNEYDIRSLRVRRALIARESRRSDCESQGRMHWLTQVLVAAVALPVLVFLGVVFADSLTGLHSVASIVAQVAR